MKINYVDRAVYELDVKKQDGNNVTEKVSHEQVLQELKDISGRYDNPVIVELSEEAAQALKENMFNEKNAELNERYKKELLEKSSLLQSYLKPATKLHRIIPNIKTNDMLEKSLKGADDTIIDAAYAIIGNNFLPHNIGDLTEEERQELISVGLEEAKLLADRLDDEKAESFMEAMRTIAKYGMNGKTDKDGNVTYDIRRGAPVGAPDDYMSTGELMKKISPDQYSIYSSMRNEAIEKGDRELYLKAVKYAIDWELKSYNASPKPFEDAKKELVEWKKNIDETQLNENYENVDRTNWRAFMDSILEQCNILNRMYLLNNLKSFIDILEN